MAHYIMNCCYSNFNFVCSHLVCNEFVALHLFFSTEFSNNFRCFSAVISFLQSHCDFHNKKLMTNLQLKAGLSFGFEKCNFFFCLHSGVA